MILHYKVGKKKYRLMHCFGCKFPGKNNFMLADVSTKTPVCHQVKSLKNLLKTQMEKIVNLYLSIFKDNCTHDK